MDSGRRWGKGGKDLKTRVKNILNQNAVCSEGGLKVNNKGKFYSVFYLDILCPQLKMLGLGW